MLWKKGTKSEESMDLVPIRSGVVARKGIQRGIKCLEYF